MKKLSAIAISLMVLLTLCVPSFAQESEYAEGEVLVVLKNGAPLSSTMSAAALSSTCAATANAAASAVNAKTLCTYNGLSQTSGMVFAHLKSNTKTADELIAELKKNPNVAAVSKNYIFKLHGVKGTSKPTATVKPDDPRYSEQWGLTKINANTAWSTTTGSEEVVVAVLDTGVMYDHPDLTANMWRENGSYGKMFHDNGQSADITGTSTSGASVTNWDCVGDINGHGTHVAGIIGAVGNNGVGVCGVNWNVKILTVGVFSVLPDGVSGYMSDIINGLNYVTALKNSGVNIRVANMSLGLWMAPSDSDVPVYKAAIETASNAGNSGILFCVSAGNESQNLDSPTGEYAGKKEYPGCFDIANMLTVGATSSDDSKGSYSNYSSSGSYVDVFAPGTAILSTCRTSKFSYNGKQVYDPSGYISVGGTSMACPMVAGSAALLAAAYPKKTAAEIKTLIINNCTSVCKTGYSKYGQIDLAAAMKAGEEPTPKPAGGEKTYSSKDVAANAIPKSNLTSTDLVLIDGNVTVSKATASDATGVDESNLVCFPIAKQTCSSGGVCVLSFEVSGSSFGNITKPSDVKFHKILGSDSSAQFTYCSDSSTITANTEKVFTIIDNATNTDAATISSSGTYIVKLYIRDGDTFDLDNTSGTVTDPAAMDVSAGNTGSKSSGGGGGCNAGLGALAVAAIALVSAKKKK